MEQRYLLTYDLSVIINGGNAIVQTYSWFESEEDMEEFILDSDNITVTDKIEILQCQDLIEEE